MNHYIDIKVLSGTSESLLPHNKVVGGYTDFTMSVRPSVDKSYVVRQLELCFLESFKILSAAYW